MTLARKLVVLLASLPVCGGCGSPGTPTSQPIAKIATATETGTETESETTKATTETASSAPSQPPTDEQARAALLEQAGRLARATVEADARAIASLTAPTLIDSLGGPEAFEKKIGADANERKSQGLTFQSIALGEPAPFVEQGSGVYTTVPYVLTLTGPHGATGHRSACFVAFRLADSRFWMFAEGGPLAADRERAKKIVPGLPDALALPPEGETVWQDP